MPRIQRENPPPDYKNDLSVVLSQLNDTVLAALSYGMFGFAQDGTKFQITPTPSEHLVIEAHGEINGNGEPVYSKPNPRKKAELEPGQTFSGDHIGVALFKGGLEIVISEHFFPSSEGRKADYLEIFNRCRLSGAVGFTLEQVIVNPEPPDKKLQRWISYRQAT